MKKALLYVCTQNLFFVILLFLSGAISGILGEVLYYLAFILPFAVTLIWAKQDKTPYKPPKIAIKAKKAGYVMPIIVPVIAAVFIVSWLSSIIFDGEPTVDVSGNILRVILTHALAVAILEESFFRYLPIALLAPHSKKVAIFLSAFLFAFVHFNPHQLVYAFVAGLIFATLDIVFDSILPSVIIHFLNNVVSIYWIRYSESKLFFTFYISILAALSLFSLVFIYVKRKEYARLFLKNLKDKR